MATLTYLTTTHFDFGALQKLPSELDKAGISKLFIATDAGVRAAGLVDKVTGALAADGNAAMAVVRVPTHRRLVLREGGKVVGATYIDTASPKQDSGFGR